MAREVRCHQTDRRTDGQTDYSNPRCACAPRVNKMCMTLAYMYVNCIQYIPVFFLVEHFLPKISDFAAVSDSLPITVLGAPVHI